MAVYPAQPASTDLAVHECVRPVPLPGEPAPQLTLGRHDRGAYAGSDQVCQRAAGIGIRFAVARVGLIPAGQLARIRVSLTSGHVQRARDDRAAPLQRGAQRIQFLPFEPELYPQVLDAGRPGGGQMVQQPAPARIGSAHAADLGPADRVKQAGDLAGHEQILAAVDPAMR